MAVIFGIDEAGYGPILGPLVVSAAGFELPDELLADSLWEVLRQSVCKNKAGNMGRLIVNDSKKLHIGQGKYQLLQRAILAHLAMQSTPIPLLFGELCRKMDFEPTGKICQYPWYNSTAENWGLSYNPDDIAIAANTLAADLKHNKMRFLGIWTRPLLEGHFNQLVQATDNKATVLFQVASELIYKVWQQFGGQNPNVVIDKHGGRSHYRQQLQRMFPDTYMKILKETETVSSYQISSSAGESPGGTARSMKIHFLAKGDDRQLPIALASMASKYMRELFMEMLNQYFRKHCPAVAPTAGYYEDGQRFLSDIDTYNLPDHITAKHLLVRQR